jgi:ribonuclease Z
MKNRFEITVLGSGTMMPTLKRYPSSYLLEINDQKILLDLGHTTLSRLTELKIDLHSIDLVFISHFHTDHFADFLPLIHSRWVDDLHKNRKHKPLTVLGPASLEKRFLKLREVFWPEPTENYPLQFLEGPRKINYPEFRIETFPITHVPWFPSVGIKIESCQKTFVYTGDLGGKQSKEDLLKICKNCDLLLIEAGHFKPTPNHFTLDEVIELSEKAKIKKTVATHLRDVHLSVFKTKLKNHPHLILAQDLLKISL